jgi:hypothetical protein
MRLVAKNRLEQHYIYKSCRCVRGVPNRQPGRYCKLPLRVPFKGQLQTGSRATLISFKLPTAPPLATPAKENTSRIQERMRNGSSGKRGSLTEFSASLQQSLVFCSSLTKNLTQRLHPINSPRLHITFWVTKASR